MTKQTPYYKQYTKIKSEVVTAVKSLIDSGFFKENSKSKLVMIKQLNTTLCNIYSTPICEVELKLKAISNNGMFLPLENKIILFKKVSIVTYLHEFKHYLQNAKNKTQNEKVARGWSLSLFYLADKKALKNAVKKGYIMHCERYEEGE